MKCYDCKKEIIDKEGIWAFHDDLPPKTDIAIHADCWLVNKNPKIHYNGNLDSEDYSIYPRMFVDPNTGMWASIPIIYRKDDIEFTQIAPAQKEKDKGDGYDRFQILGMVVEALDKEIEG